jgi:hypothetical protein
MTTFRQIEANRRNARKSTGPATEEGKQRSRCNAVRHGLTAETVIGALEDAEDWVLRRRPARLPALVPITLNSARPGSSPNRSSISLGFKTPRSQ